MTKFQKLNKSDYDIINVTEVNTKTGQILEYEKVVYTPEGNIKMQNNFILSKALTESQEYIKERFGRFFFYFYMKMDKIDIPMAHKTRFIYLSTFLDYDTEHLVTKIDGQGNVYFRVDKKRLKDLLGLNDCEHSRTLKSLIDNNVLYKDGEYFNINTEYSICGHNNKANKDCTRVFKETIRELYRTTEIKQHKNLYYLFKLLPYINKQSNVLCDDIYAEHVCNSKPLSMYQVWSKLGMDAQNGDKVYKNLKKIKLNGQYLIAKLQIGDNEYITVNPYLYYGGNNIEGLGFLLEMFMDASKTSE